MLIMYTTKSNVTWIPIIPDVNMTSPAPTPWSSMKHPSRYWKSFTTQLVHTLEFSVTQQAGYQPVSITRNNQKHSLMENCPRGCFSTTMLAVWCIVCCSVCAWQTPAHTAKTASRSSCYPLETAAVLILKQWKMYIQHQSTWFNIMQNPSTCFNIWLLFIQGDVQIWSRCAGSRYNWKHPPQGSPPFRTTANTQSCGSPCHGRRDWIEVNLVNVVFFFINL